MSKIPTYLVNLKKDVARKKNTLRQLDPERFNVHLIEAVYGKDLSEEYVRAHCDMEAIERNPRWLSPGAIGCALSHLKVYEQMLADNVGHALVLEDDKDYPDDIADLCEVVIPEMEDNEVTMLYYESPEPCEFSLRTKVDLSNGYKLLHPVQKHSPITTGAYLITRDAAKALAEGILPVRVAADTWHHFISHGMVKNFRCLYPLRISDANFKSSIGYVDVDSWRYRFTRFVDDKKIPLLNSLLRSRRDVMRNKRMKFSLVDKPNYKEGLEIVGK